MESLIKYVQDEYIDQKNFPEFKAGDTIIVINENGIYRKKILNEIKIIVLQFSYESLNRSKYESRLREVITL